jgi:hypothetical protein
MVRMERNKRTMTDYPYFCALGLTIIVKALKLPFLSFRRAKRGGISSWRAQIPRFARGDIRVSGRTPANSHRNHPLDREKTLEGFIDHPEKPPVDRAVTAHAGPGRFDSLNSRHSRPTCWSAIRRDGVSRNPRVRQLDAERGICQLNSIPVSSAFADSTTADAIGRQGHARRAHRPSRRRSRE